MTKAVNRFKATKAAAKITSPSDLREFFEAGELHEEGREPNWEEHLKAMEESRATGRSGT